MGGWGEKLFLQKWIAEKAKNRETASMHALGLVFSDSIFAYYGEDDLETKDLASEVIGEILEVLEKSESVETRSFASGVRYSLLQNGDPLGQISLQLSEQLDEALVLVTGEFLRPIILRAREQSVASPEGDISILEQARPLAMRIIDNAEIKSFLGGIVSSLSGRGLIKR